MMTPAALLLFYKAYRMYYIACNVVQLLSTRLFFDNEMSTISILFFIFADTFDSCEAVIAHIHYRFYCNAGLLKKAHLHHSK